MIKSRPEVAKRIQTLCMQINDKDELLDVTNKIEEKFGIPAADVSDILSLRRHPEEFSDFFMFAVLYFLDGELLSYYFTEHEIQSYEKAKHKADKLKFPLKLKMCEVVEGQQYIGSITLKELMKFRDASLIRYNEETQRAMKKIINGENIYYEIALDKKTVGDIKESIVSNTYIPTTLTFNLPEDTQFSYSNGELIIKEIDFLDIIDGYHRYIALSRVHDLDPKFEFNMEIRIVSFAESKAKQFIWQEDQKTKLKKIDSESLNQMNPSVKIAQQLNTNSEFLYAGKIARNGGLIDLGIFTNLISSFFYCPKVKRSLTKKNEIQYMLSVQKKLLTEINNLLSENPNIIGETWNYKLTFIVIAGIYIGIEGKDIYKLYTKTKDDKAFECYFKLNELSQRDVTQINELLGEYI